MTSKQKKLIILDRDGVINEDSSKYIKTPEEWLPIPGSIDAIAQLYNAGFTIAVATNQSGIARGYFDLTTLDAMHDKMHQLVATAGGKVDKVFFCPHGPDDNCLCRKPLPGLLHQISSHYDIDFKQTPTIMIGDSFRDIQAAISANCTPILVETGKGKQTIEKYSKKLENVRIFADLKTAAERIVHISS